MKKILLYIEIEEDKIIKFKKTIQKEKKRKIASFMFLLSNILNFVLAEEFFGNR